MVKEGFGDQWFPVEHRSLPNFLDPSIKTVIVQRQGMILTKSIDLENGRHRHFAPTEALPFEILGRLGSGGYGQVDKIKSKISFRHYALKRVRRRAAFGNNSREGMKIFINELRIVSSLKHRHFVEYIGSYTDKSYLGLVISPVADSDLASYMQRMCDRADDTSHTHDQATTAEMCINLKTYFGCLAAALTYLHSQSIRHKDIKPQNILVAKGNVLFSDFGLSRDFADDGGSTTSGLTPASPRYCAPEVAIYEARNTSSDVWSLGCVFLEMTAALHGLDVNWIKTYFATYGSQAPHFHSNPDATQQLLYSWETSWNRDDKLPLLWIKQMVSIDRQQRPTAARVLELITTTDLGESISTNFCGICCVPDNDTDSCDSLADDFDALTAVPLSNPAIKPISNDSNPPSATVMNNFNWTARKSPDAVSLSNVKAPKITDDLLQTPRPLPAHMMASSNPVNPPAGLQAGSNLQGAGLQSVGSQQKILSTQSPSVTHEQTVSLNGFVAPSPHVNSGPPSAQVPLESAVQIRPVSFGRASWSKLKKMTEEERQEEEKKKFIHNKKMEFFSSKPSEQLEQLEYALGTFGPNSAKAGITEGLQSSFRLKPKSPVQRQRSPSPLEQHSTNSPNSTAGSQAKPIARGAERENRTTQDVSSLLGLNSSDHVPKSGQRSPSPLMKHITGSPNTITGSKEETVAQDAVKDGSTKLAISNVFSENRKLNSPQKYLGVFGMPLSVSIQYAFILIDIRTTSGTCLQGRVPVVVAKCGYFLKTVKRNATNEGVVHEDRLVDCLSQISQGTPIFSEMYKKEKAIFDAFPFYGRDHVWFKNDDFRAGATLFHFLDSLPEPLIPNDAHRRILQIWLNSTSGTTTRSIEPIRSIILQIPSPNLKVVLYMLDLFALCTKASLGRPQRISTLAMKYHRCFFRLRITEDSPLHERAGHEMPILQFIIRHSQCVLEPGDEPVTSIYVLDTTKQDRETPKEDLEPPSAERSVIFSIDPSGHPLLEQLLAMGITKTQIEENMDSIKLYIEQKSAGQKVRNREIFGVPLWISYQYAKAARSLMDDVRCPVPFVAKVPVVVAECCTFLMKQSLLHQDCFHVSTEQDHERVGMLVSTFDSYPNFGRDHKWTGYNTLHAGTTLHLYLTSLPEPIIPPHAADKFISSLGFPAIVPGKLKESSTRFNACISTVFELPSPNRDLLLYLLGFFTNFEGTFSDPKFVDTFQPVFVRPEISAARTTFTLRILMKNANDIIQAVKDKRNQESESSYDHVIALYDFKSDVTGDLSFAENDRIRVLEKTTSNQDWWTGELRGEKGVFPANYCEPAP
jgi:serine/threonine protein kinase